MKAGEGASAAEGKVYDCLGDDVCKHRKLICMTTLPAVETQSIRKRVVNKSVALRADLQLKLGFFLAGTCRDLI